MALTARDEQYLKEKGYSFEIKSWADRHLLILHNFSLPEAYTPRTVDLLIEILTGYPITPLDMFWVNPEVKITASNSYPVQANVFEDKVGRKWQRFSRHYGWRPGVDCVISHLKALEKDFKKGK